MINALLGQKKVQIQKFLTDGTRIPVTEVVVSPNPIIAVKTMEKDGYCAVQLGFGKRKHPTKALMGHIKGANTQVAPQFLREIRLADTGELKVGEMIEASAVFKPGDMIDVIGISKGKGFAGGVKRYGFKGGPRTHGQSDRERAPGSIGQTTTPGRVYKGKRMAGRMGQDQVTVRNLMVVGVSGDSVLVKGLVPGGVNTMILIKKTGEEAKKFVPLFEEVEEKKEEALVEAEQEVVEVENKPTEEVKEESVVEPATVKEEVTKDATS